jgi:Tol biopolymer transport system component
MLFVGKSLDFDVMDLTAVGTGLDVRRLWLRRLDAFVPEPLPHTEGATAPFWSPDGRSIGFFSNRKLQTMNLATGAIRAIADAPDPRGGAWGHDVIVFGSHPQRALYQVGLDGGTPQPATVVDPAGADVSHGWPAFLPDGIHFLFVAKNAGTVRTTLLVSSVRSPQETAVLIENVAAAQYAPPGFVFFTRPGGAMLVQPFDVRRLQFRGSVAALPLPAVASFTGRVAFSVSGDKLLFAEAAERPSEETPARQLHWIDRSGRILTKVGPSEFITGLELSPDSQTAVMDSRVTGQLWRLGADLRPIDAGLVSARSPIWSPDGSRIAFVLNNQLHERSVASTGSGRVIADLGPHAFVRSWSPDGRLLLLQASLPTGLIVQAVPVTADAKPSMVLTEKGNIIQPQFSPDGKWLAYSSDESGRFEVYVRAYPPTGARWQVSTDGGTQPRWRGDEKEIVYVAARRVLTSVPVEAEPPALHFGTPQRLFELWLPQARVEDYPFQYAMSRDGQQFLVNRIVAPERSRPVSMLLNWRWAITSKAATVRP